jgi:hypothetical protein
VGEAKFLYLRREQIKHDLGLLYLRAMAGFQLPKPKARVDMAEITTIIWYQGPP